ncbi:MAG: glycosyltransferase family 2 protein, partial [Nitrospirae bacterium]
MVPKVTVAIPTYNRATLLKQCLETILRQTFRDFEVIVSDNCSPDATPEAVRAFNDPRIRYYRNESNLGVFPNMNRCIDRARGQYIAIVHDDDLFAPQFIEQEARLLDEHPSVGMVHCAAYETDPDGVSQRLIKVYP